MTLNFPGDFQICFGGHCHFFRIRIEIKKIFSKFSKNSIFKISCDNQHRSQTKNATGRSFEALTRPFKMTARSKLAFCRVKKRPSRKFRKKKILLWHHYPFESSCYFTKWFSVGTIAWTYLWSHSLRFLVRALRDDEDFSSILRSTITLFKREWSEYMLNLVL